MKFNLFPLRYYYPISSISNFDFFFNQFLAGVDKYFYDKELYQNLKENTIFNKLVISNYLLLLSNLNYSKNK